MAQRIPHVRISPREVEDLTICLNRLNQIHDSVNATGMAGKRAVMELSIECYHVIQKLLEREAAAVKRWWAREQEKQETTAGQGDS